MSIDDKISEISKGAKLTGVLEVTNKVIAYLNGAALKTKSSAEIRTDVINIMKLEVMEASIAYQASMKTGSYIDKDGLHLTEE